MWPEQHKHDQLFIQPTHQQSNNSQTSNESLRKCIGKAGKAHSERGFFAKASCRGRHKEKVNMWVEKQQKFKNCKFLN